MSWLRRWWAKYRAWVDENCYQEPKRTATNTVWVEEFTCSCGQKAWRWTPEVRKYL